MSTLRIFPFEAALPRVSRGKALGPTLPRMSRAAVRVPLQLDVAMEFPAGHPQIFVHEGARQALERRLAMANGKPVVLSVTDNARNVLSRSVEGPVVRIRLHHMFLDAPEAVRDALVRYLTDRDREASAVVGRFIDANGFRIKAAQPVLRPLTTQGDAHDLLTIYRTLNEKYFEGAVDALITWGKWPSQRAPRRTIKLGSYSAVERLIRVHPALDRGWVPRYFVSYVVYHEMLHHVIPSSACGGTRRRLHPPEFLAREALFRDYERSLTWERRFIGRLLRL